MGDAYYDYQPTRRLDRPFVLVSFVNELTRGVANALASTTGLPLRLLDDTVEHQLAASSVEVLDPPGLDAWRAVEKQQLIKVVRSRPSAIVALGEGALGDVDSLSFVLAEAELVYLYLSFGEVSERFARQAPRRKATVLAELRREDRFSEDGLMHLFTERRAGYEQAHRSVDVHGKAILEISRTLSRMLDG